MKKVLFGAFAAALLIGGAVFAQSPGVPTLLLPVLTGAERITVQGTGPQITSITTSQARDTSGYSIQVPVTGFSIIAPNLISVLDLNPAGTLATGQVIFPSTPPDGQRLLIYSAQVITALTLTGNTGQTVTGAVTTLGAGGSAEYIYQASTTTWFRIS